ncbi:MAG: radical SAM protein [Deltaproteobacteria bacterium]|jgi:anaerobic ribonucleoside-triphosphate reductase activating protein|nr:radical SAM protein [Deltaproteobacteria bacterium]
MAPEDDRGIGAGDGPHVGSEDGGHVGGEDGEHAGHVAGSPASGGSLPADLLYLGFTHAPLAALGPGMRAGVWTRGCALACPGCVAPELQTASDEDAVAAGDLAEWIVDIVKNGGLAGLTVSGGEPFYRPEALRILLSLVREGGVGDILVYSGRRVGELLAAHPWVPELVTALVDGPFEEGRPTESPWKGSDGQTLTVFDGSMAEIYARWEASRERPLQLAPFPGGFRILGIPRIGTYDSI